MLTTHSILFSAYILLSLPSLVPSIHETSSRTQDLESNAKTRSRAVPMYRGSEAHDMANLSQQPRQSTAETQQWGDKLAAGYLSLPRTPGTTGAMKSPAQRQYEPYTPRTVAFQTLDGVRKVGNPQSQGVRRASASGSGDLPFRERYGGIDGR